MASRSAKMRAAEEGVERKAKVLVEVISFATDNEHEKKHYSTIPSGTDDSLTTVGYRIRFLPPDSGNSVGMTGMKYARAPTIHSDSDAITRA